MKVSREQIFRAQHALSGNILGFSLSELKEMVAYWQDRLGLCDWNITVRIGGASKDMGGELAHVEHVCHKHEAEIVLATDQADYVDLMDSIIHELCHLVFWWIGNEGVESDLLERAFNRVCRAMAEDHAELIAKGVRKKKCSTGGIFSKSKTRKLSATQTSRSSGRRTKRRF